MCETFPRIPDAGLCLSLEIMPRRKSFSGTSLTVTLARLGMWITGKLHLQQLSQVVRGEGNNCMKYYWYMIEGLIVTFGYSFGRERAGIS